MQMEDDHEYTLAKNEGGQYKLKAQENDLFDNE